MAAANPYILVVDDHPDGREMLTEYLRFRGFEVIDAPDGETALTEARTRRPAVILMDLQMPGIGGWEATRQLKAHPATKDILVIALTAHALKPDEGIARQAGCDGFIAKPFDLVAVGDAVSALMQRGRRGLVAVAALAPPQGNRPRPARHGTSQVSLSTNEFPVAGHPYPFLLPVRSSAWWRAS